jgi:hypothetical protein
VGRKSSKKFMKYELIKASNWDRQTTSPLLHNNHHRFSNLEGFEMMLREENMKEGVVDSC